MGKKKYNDIDNMIMSLSNSKDKSKDITFENKDIEGKHEVKKYPRGTVAKEYPDTWRYKDSKSKEKVVSDEEIIKNTSTNSNSKVIAKPYKSTKK